MTKEHLGKGLRVGDRVEWTGAYPHLAWLRPFEIWAIDGEWATLKWISVPVRLADLDTVNQ